MGDSYFITIIFDFVVLIAIAPYAYRRWRRQPRRAKNLFERFKKSINNNPYKNNHFHLLQVAKNLQVGEGKTLKDTSVSPEEYLKEAFGEDSEIGIDRLIYNMIKMEFDESVSENLKLEDIRECRAKSEMSGDYLKLVIKNSREEVLGGNSDHFSKEVTFDPESDISLARLIFYIIGSLIIMAIAFAVFF